MANILIFGDSITYGAWDIEGGWVARLRKFVDEKIFVDPNYYNLVVNLGISGNNSENILKRFEFEVQQRVKEERENVVIFAFGTNDSQIYQGKNRVSLEKFKDNLNELLKLSKKFSSKAIFIGLFPVDESRSDPIPWATEKSYLNNEIKKYNEIINGFCKSNNLIFIDIFNRFINKNYQKLLDDGVHPNTEGHKQMFEIIKDVLMKNKII